MKIDNLEILNGLIAGAEGGTVEFKETTGQLERGIETLCAFLNGGIFILSRSTTKYNLLFDFAQF